MTVASDPHSEVAERPAPPALPNRATTRQGRSDQLRRERAAAMALRTAFPDVEQLRIELTFADRSSISPAAQVHILYPAARAFFTYPCPHSDCDGEFNLEDAVRHAVGGGTHVAEGCLPCGGVRPNEKGSKRPCELHLAFAITAGHHGDT